jgi:RNA binding motif
MRTPSK